MEYWCIAIYAIPIIALWALSFIKFHLKFSIELYLITIIFALDCYLLSKSLFYIYIDCTYDGKSHHLYNIIETIWPIRIIANLMLYPWVWRFGKKIGYRH
jgi:hypothetical protein